MGSGLVLRPVWVLDAFQDGYEFRMSSWYEHEFMISSTGHMVIGDESVPDGLRNSFRDCMDLGAVARLESVQV